MPKTGGSSMQFFFEDLFGEDRVFRIRDREITPETITIEKLTDEQINHFKVFQGHFPYGNRGLVGKDALYFGIIRDPIDRMISNYFYARAKGRPERKKLAQSMKLGEYINTLLNNRDTKFGSAQTNFLTGKRTIAEAEKVFREEYLLICTTDQIDQCQQLIAQMFGRSDLTPIHRNTTNSTQKGHAVRKRLRSSHGQFFAPDYQTLSWVKSYFEHIFNNRDEWIEANSVYRASKGRNVG